MRTYIAKRILLIFPTLFAITLLSYAMMRVAPGDPVKASLLAGAGAGEKGGVGVLEEGRSDAAEAFRKHFNLDKPWYVGYWLWIKNIFTKWNFGVSITVALGKPVWELLVERIPITIKINLWAIALVYIVALPFGLYSAVFRNSIGDRFFSIVFFMLYSMPSFWVGLLLILFVSKYFPSWPTSGMSGEYPLATDYWTLLWDAAKHYVLPVVCLSYASFAGLSRYARVGMLDVIRQDYIRTARAKGLGEWTVIMKHALRNSVIPLVVIFAGMLPGLIGGSIIIEFLFNIPGMGSLSLDALSSRDYPVLMTLFGLSATLTLIGILLSDVLLAVVDPRISFD